MDRFAVATTDVVAATVPQAGIVVSLVLSLLTISVLAMCLMRRVAPIRNWSKVPLTGWLIIAIYSDSILFIIGTTILSHGFGLNSNQTICSTAILLCLACYLTTKILIYYFLVEKVHIISAVSKLRRKSKLYLFNCFMLLTYVMIVVLNFIFRVAYINDDGICIIGMEFKSVMPLIIFDAGVNFYLTLLFVIPLRGLYTYKSNPNSALRTVTIRSFFGSLGTLTSSVVNLTILMVLHGEAAWICLMCCNADVLFSVVVLHWVTSLDSSGGTSSNETGSKSNNRKNRDVGNTYLSSKAAAANRKTADFQQMDGGFQAKFETRITARDFKGDDDDVDAFEKLNGNSFPLNRINVQVGHVRTVEIDTRDGGRSDISMAEDGQPRRVSSNKSTEELVEPGWHPKK